MAGREELQRVVSVPPQKHIVKLGLDLAVGHAAFPCKLFHIGVTGAVQRKMTDKTQRIGQRRRTVVLLLHHTPGAVEKYPAWLFVHGVAQCAHRVGLCRVVIEQ